MNFFRRSPALSLFPPTATPAGYAAEQRNRGQSLGASPLDVSPSLHSFSSGGAVPAERLWDTGCFNQPASSFPQDTTHQREPGPSGTRGAARSSEITRPDALAGRDSLPETSSQTLSQTSSAASDDDWAEAEKLAGICREFLTLREEQHYSLNQAARALGKSPSWFSGEDSALARYQRVGVAGLLPRRGETGAKAQIEVPDWFVPAGRFYYLLTNRNRNCGSVPEAIRRVISLPHTPPGWDAKTKGRLLKALPAEAGVPPALPVCPPELRDLILARERAGKPMLPPRIMRQISAPASVVHQYRHKKNAALDYLNSPGSLMWITDPDGTKRFIRAGDVLEADDGTINIPCCVPWTIRGCPSSENFGIKVGRFQFLRAIDAGSRFRPGYVYVMRPRGSYRQEDILSLILGLTRKWGKWKKFRFEKGSWKGSRVQEICRRLGIQLDTVYSPHSKAFVEGGFNQDWTKLSPYFPHCDVGRFMGETDEVTQLIGRCQQGKEDGAKHFPMLADVLHAFDAITAEEHSTPINSPNYGRWIPQERWDAQRLEQPMAPLDPETAWLFSPWVRDWTVKGLQVGGKVRLFEELSVPFDFSAEWLPKFHGALVRCYFDPFEPRCHATIVLQQNWGAHRAGEVLGTAVQINEVASYARLVMGWGDDPETAARKARQQAAAAMRREVRVIMPNGKRSEGTSELRDGIATVAKMEISGASSSSAPEASRECESRGTNCPLTSSTVPDEAGENHGRRNDLAARETAAARLVAENPLDFV